MRHVPQIINRGDGGLTLTPSVDHTVRVIVKDLLLEGVQRLVEFQPGVTGGEGRHKDVGLGAFYRIVMDTGVDSLQDVVGAQSESADVEGRIRDQTEQMGRVLDGDGGGFVDPLAEFTPETMEKRKKNEKKRKIQLGKKRVNYLFSILFASRILGNAGNIQSGALRLLVAENVLSFLFHCLATTRPPSRLLF